MEDLFGFDSGGLIGLEVRYGLFRGTQIGVLRTSDRTIELFGNGSNVGSVTSPNGFVALDAAPSFDEWLRSESSSLSSPPFAGLETDTDLTDALSSSLMTDPADENGDGFVSLTEELAYAQTHALDSFFERGDALRTG